MSDIPRPIYPIEPSAEVWKDTLDLVRYVSSGNLKGTHDTLMRYDGEADLTQQIYAGQMMVAAYLTQRLAEATGVSQEAVLDELRKIFPGET